jgi:hypothetical protein
MNTAALRNTFFQSLHGPRGANAYLALGLLGSGGLGVESDYIPKQNLFIGMTDGTAIKCLPFFSGNTNDWLKDYMVGGVASANGITLYQPAEIRRDYRPASDTFTTPDFSLSVSSLVDGIPDPETARYRDMKFAVAPFVVARLSVDNTNRSHPVTVFMAVDGIRGVDDLAESTNGEYCGFVEKKGYALAARMADRGRTIQHNSMKDIFMDRRPNFKLSRTAGVALEVPPGERKTLDIVVAFYKNGSTTRGRFKSDYLYKEYFTDMRSVIDYAYDAMAEHWARVHALDADPRIAALNVYRQFMINHARRGYHASSILLSEGAKGRYVVNEGTFMMMNTLDLAVDHLAFEIPGMAWAVRNQLDSFIDDYSYYDALQQDGQPALLPGGISFAHDQGLNGYFTPRGTSSYETPHGSGCFAFMTAEQLCNFIAAAGAYLRRSNDMDWLRRRRSVLEDCLTSMVNRDNPAEARRNGILSHDSDRCQGGAEITTYDSLDASLGQARGNVYIATRFFACFLIFKDLFKRMSNHALAQVADAQAHRSAATLCAGFDETLGYLPAILHEDNNTAIIPAVEGLAQLHLCGLTGELAAHPELMATYRRHISGVLKKGVCLFDDMGWKLSASNDNSWMSKIVSNQFVVENILGMDLSRICPGADATHANWWADGCRESPCVDQIFAGQTNTSGFHYPRGVTCDLWIQSY